MTQLLGWAETGKTNKQKKACRLGLHTFYSDIMNSRVWVLMQSGFLGSAEELAVFSCHSLKEIALEQLKFPLGTSLPCLNRKIMWYTAFFSSFFFFMDKLNNPSKEQVISLIDTNIQSPYFPSWHLRTWLKCLFSFFIFCKIFYTHQELADKLVVEICCFVKILEDLGRCAL